MRTYSRQPLMVRVFTAGVVLLTLLGTPGISTTGSSIGTPGWSVPTAWAVIGPCTPSFSNASNSPFTTPNLNGPASTTFADLDGDGDLDLAVANLNTTNVTILLNNGVGGFAEAPGSPVTVGTFPRSIVAARLNGDASIDLAVLNQASNDVTILLNNGAAGFTQAPGSPILTGGATEFLIAAGDLDGDGDVDLATANAGTNDVTVLLNNGAGGFTIAPGSPMATGGTFPGSVTAGDLDGDGDLDLAATNSGTGNVTIFRNNGAGGFTIAPGSPFLSGGINPGDVAAVDLDGDRDLDLAVTNINSNNVSIFRNDGAGNFTPAPGSPFGAGTQPASVKAGDLDNDGDRDLAIANFGSDDLTVLLNNGSGGFAPLAGSPFATGLQAISADFGELDRDNDLDIVVANYTGNTVSFLLNGCQKADLQVTKAATPNPVQPGGQLTYTLTTQNLGANPATTVTLTDTLPASTTFVSLAAAPGWSCTSPPVGAGGTVTCTIAALPVGTISTFTLVVQVPASAVTGSTLANTARIDAATADFVGGNNTATVTTGVGVAPAVPEQPPVFDPNNDDKEDEKETKNKESEDQRRHRERTNQSGRSDVSLEGNVLAVEKAPDGKSQLVIIGLTRGETQIVQVPCFKDGNCHDIRVGDYLEADGYQNGVGDPNTYFVATEDVEVTRNGKRVK